MPHLCSRPAPRTQAWLTLGTWFCLVAAAPPGPDAPMPADPAQASPAAPDVLSAAPTPSAEAKAAPAAATDADNAVVPLARDPQEGEDELTLDEWERDEWAQARSRTSLFDVGGYFRVRGDVFRRMDFGNQAQWESANNMAQLRYPYPPGGHARYNHVSMRLRIEPRLHISDAVQLHSTIDLFDNFIFGSTPSTLPTLPNDQLQRPPANVLSTGQWPLRRGVNAFSDALVVKRLWGRVAFLHDQLELKVGRMPDQWGLGMWINSGDCLNCDGGTNVDRISLGFRALGHVLMPHVDWVSRGPLRQVFGQNDPTWIVASTSADAMAYGLRISKEEHPDDIRDALAHQRTVTVYGLSNTLRTQSRDLSLEDIKAGGYEPGNPRVLANMPERRDAFIYMGDGYAKWFSHKVELGAEAALVAGTFYDTAGDAANATDPGNGEQKTRVLQGGAALEALWHLRDDRRGTRLSLKLGGASGDNHPGMGARNYADTQRGTVGNRFDRTLTNFHFNPDYHLDLLLFRRILGEVTDAWYVRPEVAYRFDDKLSGRLSTIYAQAFTDQSTPSSNMGLADGQNPLGVEIDGEMAYGLLGRDERGQLLGSLAGGILIPLGGMRAKLADSSTYTRGKFAWTLQARMFVTF